MRTLLDINVLLALLDSDHVDHDRAHAWLQHNGSAGWATCPITENGLVRIISQPRYPSPISSAAAVRLLADATAAGDHRFWPCDISVLTAATVNPERLLGPRQVTDAYLLALAVAHGGRLATFDTAIVAEAAVGARHDQLVRI